MKHVSTTTDVYWYTIHVSSSTGSDKTTGTLVIMTQSPQGRYVEEEEEEEEFT
jgi:hypothetical protein